MENNTRFLILYASQTGNAIDAAERVGSEAEHRGCPATVVLSMDDFHVTTLPNEEAVVFVVSTTGQGDIPNSMKVFWRFLLQKNLSQNWLKGVRYAVFGLGDSGYQKFNFAAKKLDKRLSDLGGTPIIERGLGDDQHPLGFFLFGVCIWMGEIKNQLLTRVGCGKDVCHVEFEALSPGMRYQVGDALEVLPSQDPSAVEAFIQRCNMNPDSYITVCIVFCDYWFLWKRSLCVDFLLPLSASL
ncbi:hypothetical protein IFM89_000644 [Coptis chinensis]|uniref:Flavodoxin-like domain-containing protein n=1 Tax=Coptis chinensis TaxID=261450 RepID=A0A835M3W3_9MAGN|nr:hypothetical protein IFM89_000644 [Coptis chinensis]